MGHLAWSSLLVVCACASEAAVPLPSGDVIGTWRHLPHDPTRTAIEEREVVELRADGSYSIVKRGGRGIDRGTYVIDGNALTIRSHAGGWITTGFAATEELLVIDALFPEDIDDDGFVGTWRGAQSSSVASTEIRFELRRDGTARMEQTGALSEALEVTWRHDAPFVLVTFTQPTRTRALPALPGIAIGEWLYERIE
jgi:hypothetical protein